MELDLEEVVLKSTSWSDVCRYLKLPINGPGIRKAKQIVDDGGFSKAHFTHSPAERNRKYPQVEKLCPVCETPFMVAAGGRKEKATCSHGCSNTFFRRRRNKPEKYTGYRSICFHHWGKSCSMCGFDKIVTVHHIDENHKNHDKDNLIPLCPNHHQMVHSKKFGDEMRAIIKKLAETRVETN
jgi:hypothetical protein